MESLLACRKFNGLNGFESSDVFTTVKVKDLFLTAKTYNSLHCGGVLVIITITISRVSKCVSLVLIMCT